MVVEKKKEEESVDKKWARACGESLLKNLDFVDVVSNVKESVEEIATKNGIDGEELVTWFLTQTTT